jgi:hypothetical protein
MDSILIVFYSYTGVSRRVAQLISAQQGWPMGEVSEVRPRSGGLGYLRCLLDSMLHLCPAVKYEGPDPAGFRTVVLVSPVWAHALCGPMRSFVSAHRGSLRRFAVLSTMGTAGAASVAAEVSRIVGRPPVLSAGLTQAEVQSGSGAQRAHAFGDALVPRAAPVRFQPALA